MNLDNLSLSELKRIEDAVMTKNVNGITGEHLLSVIERVERLEQDKAVIADDIKSVYAEAKNNGFDTKILKQIVKIRKIAEEERQEQEALMDTYMIAIGMGVEQ